MTVPKNSGSNLVRAHRPWRYGVALLITAAAFAVRLALNPWFGHEVPFITFFPAVALSVWYAGIGPAVMVMALGYLAANLFIIAPRYSLYIANLSLLALHVMYFTSCALIILLGELARRRGEVAESSAQSLRESERRHRFLLRLDDALRPLAEPQEIKGTAAQLLGEHLQASQVAYQEFAPDEDTFTVVGDFASGVPSMAGHHRLSTFGREALQLLLQGGHYRAQADGGGRGGQPQRVAAGDGYRRREARPLRSRGAHSVRQPPLCRALRPATGGAGRPAHQRCRRRAGPYHRALRATRAVRPAGGFFPAAAACRSGAALHADHLRAPGERRHRSGGGVRRVAVGHHRTARARAAAARSRSAQG